MPLAITKSSLRDEQVMAGRRLGKARRCCGVTVTEAARRVGIPRETWTAYEKGRLRIPASLVFRAWRALFINPDWLQTEQGLPLLPFPDGLVLPTVDGSLRFSEVHPRLIPFFDAVERDLAPRHVATIESFLAAAREGRTPRGALAVVADAIYRATQDGTPAKVAITSTPPAAPPTPPATSAKGTSN